MSNPFNVDVASSWEALATRWSRMQARGLATPFQNARWQSIWYGVFGRMPDVDPLLVAVSDQRSGEDILLLPLIRRRVFSKQIIEFADLWVTDYNAPLIAPDAPSTPEATQLLWNEVRRALPDADLIRFTKMPLMAGGRTNPLAMLEGAHPSKFTGYAVDLPDSWEDYLGSLKKDVRSLLQRRWRRLTEGDKAGFRWVEDPDEGLNVLRTLQAQQTARLASRGARHVFDDSQYIAFYERLVVEGLIDGSTVLTTLVAEGQILATFLAVTDGKRCTLIRSSQSAEQPWAKLGLGKLIIERSMHALHERGIRCFDLSIGDFQYKHDFQVVPVPLFDFDAAQTWRGTSVICRDYLWARLKSYPRVANLATSLKRSLSSKAASL
jgi:CelD/BcsL family acetyltransferase involved in cellulose biosynthesis